MPNPKQGRRAISPTRAEDYTGWYQKVIEEAELAEQAPGVRGSMVIKPWGFAIWEKIQRLLDIEIKATGHQNIYLPLFIPLHFFQKEAHHIDGFAKECAVVTHRRLVKDREGQLVPGGELEEPLIVRPTSEMMIGELFARWVNSYRDLPLLFNQWANIVRWEMRPRLFLRTTEFLWQEGHTAHAHHLEAIEEAQRMAKLYATFIQQVMAIPLIEGEKSEKERFPGAVATYTLEAMMQDGKALQAGTSHFLGQNFSRAAKITFQTDQETTDHVWTTSWGVTTRLIGAMIMVHSDDNGLVLPPQIAPCHLVILPMTGKGDHGDQILELCHTLKAQVEAQLYQQETIRVEIDQRPLRGGTKFWSWIKKGVPLIAEIGPRELNQGRVSLRSRLDPDTHLETIPFHDLAQSVSSQLLFIQRQLFQQALDNRQKRTQHLKSRQEFVHFFSEQGPRGFGLVDWAGDTALETQLQHQFGVTLRALIDRQTLDLGLEEDRTCPFTGNDAPCCALFARAY